LILSTYKIQTDPRRLHHSYTKLQAIETRASCKWSASVLQSSV